MPYVYLSPSMQPYNLYIDGGNEQHYMNLVADAMIPYMEACGIQYTRNNPDMQKLPDVIEQSNRGKYDLHLALHSNAAPEHLSGQLQGTDIYYNPGNRWSKKLADIISQNMKLVYPNPDKVDVVPTTTLAEVKNTSAPSVLVEIAYHDNAEDSQWIKKNIDLIAKALVLSMTEYFGIPFLAPQPRQKGVVTTDGSNLNLRSHPSLFGRIIGRIPSGAEVTVFAKTGDWYVTGYGSMVGYAYSKYISIL